MTYPDNGNPTDDAIIAGAPWALGKTHVLWSAKDHNSTYLDTMRSMPGYVFTYANQQYRVNTVLYQVHGPTLPIAYVPDSRQLAVRIAAVPAMLKLLHRLAAADCMCPAAAEALADRPNDLLAIEPTMPCSCPNDCDGCRDCLGAEARRILGAFDLDDEANDYTNAPDQCAISLERENEGWTLGEHPERGLTIEADPGAATFATDADAFRFVYKRSLTDDRTVHALAIRAVEIINPVEYERLLRAAKLVIAPR